jgi:hypothetical protein
MAAMMEQVWFGHDGHTVVRPETKIFIDQECGHTAQCVTNLGTLRFMIYGGALNTTLFLDFLRRLVKWSAPLGVDRLGDLN